MNIVLPLERLAVLTESSCGEFPEESGVGRFCYGKLDFVLFPMFMVDKVRKEIILAFMVMGFFYGIVQADVVDDYNSKPIISGYSIDRRWQERIRMPSDPEVVLGKDWRRSFWIFNPSFVSRLISKVDNRPPQPAYVSTANLSPGLEAIELRVSWDAEENLYRCSYHLFISNNIPLLLPRQSIGGMVAIPRFPIGIGPDDSLSRKEVLGTTMVFSKIQMLNGLTVLESIYNIQNTNLTYVSFYQGTCSALAHSSAEEKLEVGVAIDPAQEFFGAIKKNRDRIYAIFLIPSSLIRVGAPYFRRASKINDCYFSERRSPEAIAREPVAFREQREITCKQLRTFSIDSTEKPFDIK